MRLGEVIKNTLDAFAVAFRNFLRPERITVYYPYEKLELGGGRIRGWIGLWTEKCTSCMLCARICPTNAIKMYLAPNTKRYPGIDYGRCIMCHYCIDVCPTDALYPTDVRDLAWYRYSDMIYTPDMEREPPRVPELASRAVRVEIRYERGRPVKVRL